MVYKEDLLYVVGIHEPASDSNSVVASGFAGTWMVHVQCIDLDPVVLWIKDLDILFAVCDKRFAMPVYLVVKPVVGDVRVA